VAFNTTAQTAYSTNSTTRLSFNTSVIIETVVSGFSVLRCYLTRVG